MFLGVYRSYLDMTYGVTREARCNLKCGQHSISPLLLLSFIVQRKKRNVAVVEKSAHLNFK